MHTKEISFYRSTNSQSEGEELSYRSKISEEHIGDPRQHIKIVLESYDDLFSDFDPRGYSERNISDDFIEELKARTTKDRNLLVRHITFLLSDNDNYRNAVHEDIIKTRIKQFFKYSWRVAVRSDTRQRKLGLIWFIVGALLLIISAVLSIPDYQNSLPLVVFLFNSVLNAAGYYIIWNGLDLMLFGLKDEKDQLQFFKQMSRLKLITFKSYHDSMDFADEVEYTVMAKPMFGGTINNLMDSFKKEPTPPASVSKANSESKLSRESRSINEYSTTTAGSVNNEPEDYRKT